MTRILRWLLLGSLLWQSVAVAEVVEVPCEEYARITGDNHCKYFKVVTVEKSSWDATKRRYESKHKEKICRDAVLQKYQRYIKYSQDGATWMPRQRPEQIPEKDWVSCGPVELWSGKESYACYNELEACK